MRTWLRKMREDRRMTQKDTGLKLGISESYYCSIERGERQKRMDMMVMTGLSVAFAVPLAEIISAESEYLKKENTER